MRRSIVIAMSSAAMLSPALAHTGIGDTSGISHGFLHPVSGLDHVLAMVAVGIFAAHLGGRALWLVPLTFVTVMAAAGMIGMAGIRLPYTEVGISLSVVVLGGIIAFGWSPPLAVAMALVGVFAIFHGHAHGAEMPDTASGLAYGAGFVAATALLHVAGIAIGLGLERLGRASSQRAAQIGGGLMAAAGIGLLAGVI